MKHLIDLEQEALYFQNKGDFEKAAVLFSQIVNEYPNYEFGSCFSNLAHCLEELGQYNAAEENYIKAIEYDSEDHARLGNYASFLYLHGDTQAAFEKHIELIKLENKLGFDISNTIIALKTLGIKLRLTEREIMATVSSL